MGMNRRIVGIVAVTAVMAATLVPLGASTAQAAPVGNGFTLTVPDLQFILDQIKIAEAHKAADKPATCTTVEGLTVANCAVPGTNPYVRGSLVTTDLADPRLVDGLRQTDGRNNNLVNGFSPWNGVRYTSSPGQSAWGSADSAFPRDTPETWRLTDTTNNSFGPVGSTYNPSSRPKNLVDPQPRVISNLISDQSAYNPAAVAAAGADISGLTTDQQKQDTQLLIENIAPDAGQSAPYNGMFTIFGQFFDHGLDLVGKTSAEAVFIPLKSDDPLYREGARNNFMVLNRTVLDANNAGTNTTTPWVDQNQTYTSAPSHQVFLRGYGCGDASSTTANCAPGSAPVATGDFLDGAITHNLANWSEIKAQAANKLGIALTDYDVTNVPLLATDEFGRFLRGPNGFPLVVLKNGTLLEGNPASPIETVNFANVAKPEDLIQRTDHAFLDDIAHGAGPKWAWNGSAWAATHNAALLNRHFVTGDGRGNENIALTAIHTVFHNEHNRLVDDIKSVVTANQGAVAGAGIFKFEDWRVDNSAGAEFNGERLFQAARFVNEMEYQHLVFEEFVRKVQPETRPFGSYDPSLNPNIVAEFANATYRYGHSQLNETVDRIAADGTDTSISLIDAFLDPDDFNNVGGEVLTGDQAVGQIARGMSKQRGNEIDEFVTGALKNSLLGLPLDLGALNMSRGRDTGMPSLNGARRSYYDTTGDPSMTPYGSWLEFGQALRHPASLINFVAAYGTHPSVTAATTVADKRAAATLLVKGGLGEPADSAEFMTSQGAWIPVNDLATTGLEDIDLWIGGLAEQRTPAGGMLGATNDFIFRAQMEKLQESDRFYYLGRIPGIGLLNQIEGNSLAEIIQRNSDAEDLPFNIFDVPSKTFNMSKSSLTYPDISVKPDGTWAYSGSDHVVFNGTAGNDGVSSGSGNDTIRGNDGDDTINGGYGDDSIIGGLGDDTLTDPSGIDVVMSGDGSDFINTGGPGLDVYLAGAGSDFTMGGGYGTEQLGGPGNDFMYGGTSADALSGDEDSDWLEGGVGDDSLSGDLAAIFGVDIAPPGDDVMIGDSGSNRINGEGGVDIMVGGTQGTNRVLGGLGFDFSTYYNPRSMAAHDAALDNFAPPLGAPDLGMQDRYKDVEALSGGDLDDILSGDNRTTMDVLDTVGDTLNASDIAKISGLNTLLGGDAAFNTGNILIGGGGSDTLQGRQGDEVIDGDAYLQVQISAPASPAITGTTSVDPSDATRVLVNSMTQLTTAVRKKNFAISQLRIVRSIKWAAHSTELDVAVYNSPRANFTLAAGPNGTLRVTDNTVGNGNEGVDTLRNMERIQFTDETVELVAPSAPQDVTATFDRVNQRVRVSWTPPVANSVLPVTGYTARVREAGTDVLVASCSTEGAGRNCDISANGSVAYDVDVVAINVVGTGVAGPNPPITLPAFVVRVPSQPLNVTGVVGNGSVALSWTAPTDDGGADVDRYVVTSTPGGTVCTVNVVAPAVAPATTCNATGLTNFRSYRFTVTAHNVVGDSLPSAQSSILVPLPQRPAAPGVISGTVGDKSVRLNWTAPSNNGGSRVFQYEVFQSPGGARVCNIVSAFGTPSTTCTVSGLTNGSNYTFTVKASNIAGTSADSSPSVTFTPRAATTQPLNVVGTPADQSITVSWDRPANDGGSAITSYTVDQAGAGQVCTVVPAAPAAEPVTSCVVSGLTNGTNYAFTVRAVNGAGTSPSSGLSTPVAPRTVVLAPTVVTSTARNAGAAISWNAPASDGGSAVTGYKVFASPGDLEVCTVNITPPFLEPATNCIASGLVNGTPYTFTVKAVNAAGDSSPSDPSAAITPDGVAPTAAMVDPSDEFQLGQTIGLTWSASDADTGVRNTDVRYFRVPVGGGTPDSWEFLVQGTTDRSATLTEAAWGYSYCFQARGHDEAGNDGDWSASKCTNVVADSRSFARSKFALKTASGYIGNTYETTTTKGAYLLSTSSQTVRQVGVVAMTCSSCGVVKVYVGATYVGQISLKKSGASSRSLLLLPRFTNTKVGKIKIVASNGKTVRLDGIAISGS